MTRQIKRILSLMLALVMLLLCQGHAMAQELVKSSVSIVFLSTLNDQNTKWDDKKQFREEMDPLFDAMLMPYLTSNDCTLSLYSLGDQNDKEWNSPTYNQASISDQDLIDEQLPIRFNSNPPDIKEAYLRVFNAVNAIEREKKELWILTDTLQLPFPFFWVSRSKLFIDKNVVVRFVVIDPTPSDIEPFNFLDDFQIHHKNLQKTTDQFQLMIVNTEDLSLAFRTAYGCTKRTPTLDIALDPTHEASVLQATWELPDGTASPMVFFTDGNAKTCTIESFNGDGPRLEANLQTQGECQWFWLKDPLPAGDYLVTLTTAEEEPVDGMTLTCYTPETQAAIQSIDVGSADTPIEEVSTPLSLKRGDDLNFYIDACTSLEGWNFSFFQDGHPMNTPVETEEPAPLSPALFIRLMVKNQDNDQYEAFLDPIPLTTNALSADATLQFIARDANSLQSYVSPKLDLTITNDAPSAKDDCPLLWQAFHYPEEDKEEFEKPLEVNLAEHFIDANGDPLLYQIKGEEEPLSSSIWFHVVTQDDTHDVVTVEAWEGYEITPLPQRVQHTLTFSQFDVLASWKDKDVKLYHNSKKDEAITSKGFECSVASENGFVLEVTIDSLSDLLKAYKVESLSALESHFEANLLLYETGSDSNKPIIGTFEASDDPNDPTLRFHFDDVPVIIQESEYTVAYELSFSSERVTQDYAISYADTAPTLAEETALPKTTLSTYHNDFPFGKQETKLSTLLSSEGAICVDDWFIDAETNDLLNYYLRVEAEEAVIVQDANGKPIEVDANGLYPLGIGTDTALEIVFKNTGEYKLQFEAHDHTSRKNWKDFSQTVTLKSTMLLVFLCILALIVLITVLCIVIYLCKAVFPDLVLSIDGAIRPLRLAPFGKKKLSLMTIVLSTQTPPLDDVPPKVLQNIVLRPERGSKNVVWVVKPNLAGFEVQNNILYANNVAKLQMYITPCFNTIENEDLNHETETNTPPF